MDWADGVESWANAEYGQAEQIEYKSQPPTLTLDESETAKFSVPDDSKQVQLTVQFTNLNLSLKDGA
jgi:hypothetical protein